MNEVVYDISIAEVAKAVLKKWWIIVLAVVLGAVVALAYTKYLVVPTYKTTAKLGVHTTDEKTSATTDANFGYVISRDCADVITGNVVLGNAADKLNAYAFPENDGMAYRKYTAAELSKMVSAKSFEESKFFEVTVTSIYPEEARIVAEKVIEAFCEGVSRDDLLAKGGAEGKVVHRPTTPTSQATPNTTLNVLIGTVFGLVISCVGVIIAHFASNSLQSEEWLITMYGENIPLLAVVPDTSSSNYSGYYKGKNYSSTVKRS